MSYTVPRRLGVSVPNFMVNIKDCILIIHEIRLWKKNHIIQKKNIIRQLSLIYIYISNFYQWNVVLRNLKKIEKKKWSKDWTSNLIFTEFNEFSRLKSSFTIFSLVYILHISTHLTDHLVRLAITQIRSLYFMVVLFLHDSIHHLNLEYYKPHHLKFSNKIASNMCWGKKTQRKEME